MRGVGICANVQLALANVVRPLQDGVEFGWRCGGRQLERAEHDVAGGAVDRHGVAFTNDHVTHGELLAVDLHRFGTHHCRRPPSACDDGGMTHETTT